MQGRCRVVQVFPEILFYDGHCGLCHGLVRFLLRADGAGDKFRFAPLQGELFRASVPEAQRADLPDSVVLRAADGALLIRSAAGLHILGRLGGAWRGAAFVLRLLPRGVCDALYDFIARRRHRWFAPPADVCPVVPAHLRSRFLL